MLSSEKISILQTPNKIIRKLILESDLNLINHDNWYSSMHNSSNSNCSHLSPLRNHPLSFILLNFYSKSEKGELDIILCAEMRDREVKSSWYRVVVVFYMIIKCEEKKTSPLQAIKNFIITEIEFIRKSCLQLKRFDHFGYFPWCSFWSRIFHLTDSGFDEIAPKARDKHLWMNNHFRRKKENASDFMSLMKYYDFVCVLSQSTFFLVCLGAIYTVFYVYLELNSLLCSLQRSHE